MDNDGQGNFVTENSTPPKGILVDSPGRRPREMA
jgi:hypothetical protein